MSNISKKTGTIKNSLLLNIIFVCCIFGIAQCQQVFNKYTDAPEPNINIEEFTMNDHPDVEELRELTLPINHHSGSGADAWNYTLHGTDWTVGNCGNKFSAQSPLNVTHVNATNHHKKVIDWASKRFAFVTKFRPTPIEWHGPQDFVYMIKLTNTSSNGFQGFWGTEPFNFQMPQNHIVQFGIDHIRFHYRSEHQFEDKQADLEMQIFHNVTQGTVIACAGEKAAISVFFNLTSTESNNGFFDFQTQPQGSQVLDLSKILDIGSVMKSFVTGYVGTDTMPPCLNKVCWYIYEKHFQITQVQLNYFLVNGISFTDGNWREKMLSRDIRYRYVFTNKGIFAKGQWPPS